MSPSTAFLTTRLGALTIAALGLATLALSASAADWPQFMGPNGDATSAEKGLMRAFPSGGPKVLWSAPTGPGYGGAAIRDGKVYLLDRVDQQKDVLRCFDLLTGKEEWTFGYDAPGRIDHDGSRNTPAVSENYVFTIGPFGHLHCLDRTTHQVVWKKNILTDYVAKRPRWGVTQSPLLYQDMVIIAPQSRQAGVVALDQATGKEKWHSSPIGTMAYASPLQITLHGEDQFVIVTEEGPSAVSAKTGKVLWSYPHACRIPVPNVTAMEDGKLFVTGAYRAGSAVIQVSRQGDKWTVKQLGRHERIGGHCHPALYHDKHLYILCNVNERRDGMVCFDQNAKVVWQTQNKPNLDKGGSILTADGLIYLVDGQTGELHIIEPSPKGFKSLSKTPVLSGDEIWGPLALADGKLVLRDQSQIKCLDLRAD